MIFIFLFLFLGCGRSGPLVLGGEIENVNEYADSVEQYFKAKGLDTGWSSHVAIHLENKSTIEKWCGISTAGCMLSLWKIAVWDQGDVKQEVKHELGHVGAWRLGDMDADHKIYLDFWEEIQFE